MLLGFWFCFADYVWFPDKGFSATVVRVLRSKTGGTQTQWFLDQVVVTLKTIRSSRSKFQRYILPTLNPTPFYTLEALTLVHAAQKGCAAINRILDGEASRDPVKGVLDALVEGWSHHPPQHFRASLRAWRLAAAHKKSELRRVVCRLRTRGFFAICILVWFLFRADCGCSMVELVGAAHVLHDSRCVQVLFVVNSQN